MGQEPERFLNLPQGSVFVDFGEGLQGAVPEASVVATNAKTLNHTARIDCVLRIADKTIILYERSAYLGPRKTLFAYDTDNNLLWEAESLAEKMQSTDLKIRYSGSIGSYHYLGYEKGRVIAQETPFLVELDVDTGRILRFEQYDRM